MDGKKIEVLGILGKRRRVEVFLGAIFNIITLLNIIINL